MLSKHIDFYLYIYLYMLKGSLLHMKLKTTVGYIYANLINLSINACL